MRISANKKVWKTLLCLAAGLLCCCCMLCLAACDEDSGGKPAEHTHDWGEWTVVQEPTCTREGQRQRVCKSDSSHVETEAIAALGHDLIALRRTTGAETTIFTGRSVPSAASNLTKTNTSIRTCASAVLKATTRWDSILNYCMTAPMKYRRGRPPIRY